MRAFGLIGTLLTLAFVGYLVKARLKTSSENQAAKMKEEWPINDIQTIPGGSDLTKMPKAIQKNLEKTIKDRTPKSFDD